MGSERETVAEEQGHSARCSRQVLEVRTYRRTRVQELLTAKAGRRRRGSGAGLTLLHHDHDVQTIARPTGRTVRMTGLKE